MKYYFLFDNVIYIICWKHIFVTTCIMQNIACLIDKNPRKAYGAIKQMYYTKNNVIFLTN